MLSTMNTYEYTYVCVCAHIYIYIYIILWKEEKQNTFKSNNNDKGIE